MPFKSLSSPRQVLDLAGEIRASAALVTPALVAVVSTDPVRVGIQPASGGSGRVTQLGLSSGDDVALLSRDVAVVRSGNDVWALLDVAHTAKTNQVARDARSLHGRPSGGEALVLGWDGGATALTLGKDEVAARPFALRGAARACNLDAVETFVVVDGPGGGELRVHRGATPEPGPSARCPLPAEAAPLDRLRGGRDLCVLFKPGRREVCVVQRTGGRMAPKVLQLEVSPADVVVAETSFFTVFADGRAGLYDGATLSAASGDVEATAAIVLGARGEPRTVTATGKGSVTIWVGTGAGELLQVAAVRKTP